MLQRLTKDKWTSSVDGSQGNFLWVSRHRTPEERHKIRAILQCKDFFDVLRGKWPEKQLPQREFDWRGRVFVSSYLGPIPEAPSSADLP